MNCGTVPATGLPDASGRLRARPARSAFTLIELLVVIGIIILLIGIAAPAVGPAMTSNYRMQTLNALNSSLVNAQTFALANTTDVAIRVERAVRLDGYGRVANRSNPELLDHQQIRFVLMNKAAGVAKPGFRYIKDSKITALPSSIWLAPTNFYTNDGNSSNDFAPGAFYQPTTSAGTLYDPDKNGAAGYHPFDNFYIVFSPNGLLKIWRVADQLWYIDDTQQFENEQPPLLLHPQDSAPGVLMYERKKLANAPNSLPGLFQFLRTNGQSLYVNRFLGTTVEGQ